MLSSKQTNYTATLTTIFRFIDKLFQCNQKFRHSDGTFKEAAAALNLLQSDEEWDRCLAEASSYQMPCALRSLFAIILCHCLPTNPYTLWLDHRNALVEDYSTRFDDGNLFDLKWN